MAVRRAARRPGRAGLDVVGLLACLVGFAGLLTGCGPAATSTAARDGGSVPGNVTVQDSLVMPPPLPATLVSTSGHLADLVDFHDADFSGSWFDASDHKLHIGVATPSGQALLDKNGLAANPAVVGERADRSLIQGQRFAEAYVRHSSLKGSIVGWGALPQGDGIELFVHRHRLTQAELQELGGLPVRVVVTLGVNGGRPL